MKWLKRSALAGVLALASILGTALTTLPAGAKATIPQTCGAWSVVPYANYIFNGSLNGVAAVSASNVWAVGYYESGGTPQSLFEHWNGTSWQAMGLPLFIAGEGANDMSGVAPVSTSHAWAVGQYSNSSGAGQTLTAYFDGTSWYEVPSPNVSASDNELHSVAAISASNVWAVGSYTDNTGAFKTLIEQWNGSSWSVVPSPNVGSGDNELSGVTAVSASNVWAVGYDFNSGANATQTLIEHWNGSSWQIVSSPNLGSVNVLSAVARIPGTSQIWAVGNSYPYGGHTFQTLIERWNGSSWQITSSPNVGTNANRLWGVAAISASNVWAVGYANQTLIEHWNGSSWQVVPSPNVGSSPNGLYGVTRVPGTSQAWAVGNYVDTSNNNQPLTEFYC